MSTHLTPKLNQKTKKLFLLCSFITISIFAKADSTDFVWKTFYGNAFNPGISLGLGSGRMYYVTPSLTLKVGPFSVKGNMWSRYSNQYDNYENYSYLFEANILRIKKKSKIIQTFHYCCWRR